MMRSVVPSRLTLAAAGSAALLTVVAPAHARIARTGDATVSFHATGTAGMSFTGTTSELRADEQGGIVVVVVALGGLKTGIALRDRHMRERYLEVDKFPNAELRVARGALQVPAPETETSATATGTVTLHGQSKPVRFSYVAKRQGGAIRVAGAMRVNMKDFGIQAPSYLKIAMNPEVDVAVRFQATDN
jgi:polyisoprenoid-binding protein YceI